MGAQLFWKPKRLLCAILAAISLTSFGFAQEFRASPKEALMLRRISEYWKDGDYASVKRQIVDFLKKNPDTSLHDHLNAMLGDLYFQERNFRQALATYDLIGNSEIREKTFFNHMQAHFELRDYLAVIDKAERFIKERKEPGDEKQTKVRYLLAEACFRQALKCNEREEKDLYLKMAKPHYKILTQTKYSDRVLFPLAEIHRLLRENDRATSLYLNLAKKYPEHRERFLFQAAIMQIKDNKVEAAKTFAKVHEMGGKRSRLAAFNRLILLYQMEHYEEFLAFHQEVISLMPEQKVPLLHFYEGRSYYYLGDYQQAILPLENFVTKTIEKTKELKTALLLLVNCSRYLKDISLLERTLYSYKSTFPKDGEVPKILMVHAQMCRDNGDYTQALSDLKAIASDYPGYEEAESVMYDYALLLSQAERYVEAREMFLSFLDKYPKSEKKMSAWRHLLNCCIEEMKDPNQSNSSSTKEFFAQILAQALDQEKVLNDREKQQYALVMIKCHCELGKYEDAMPLLSQYIADVTDPHFLAEAHLLMAICHQKVSSDLSLFVQHGEKALTLDPKISDHQTLHLELYNAYLTKGLSTEDKGNKEYFFHQAADHLFESNAWKDRSIKLDNFLWLANHYYQLSKENEADYFDRARLLFSALLGVDQGENGLNIGADALHLEGEVLKFAHLLGVGNRKKEQVSLLETLVHRQEEHPNLAWKLKRRSVLELAKAYENDHQYQKALNSYRHLVKTKEQFPSTISDSAILHLAKLEYRLLKPEQRKSEGPEMISILHALKDLQIQKKLLAEPIYLEAALQYAEVRSVLSDQHPYGQNAIFFYKRMSEDFHSTEDLIGEEYNTLRNEHPEKNAIFSAYMQYLDGQILKNQAYMARDEKKVDKAAQLEEEALQIFNDLWQNEKVLKPYLFERVKRARMELTKQI